MEDIWDFDYNTYKYEDSLSIMENYVQNIIMHQLPNRIWLLENHDVYTGGSSATPEDIIVKTQSIPYIKTNRGGKWTYHGIGQRIIYPIVSIWEEKDISLYISQLEEWIILSLNSLNIDAFRKKNMTGVWVLDEQLEKKICAIGVRVKKWIAYHGLSLNVNCNLDNFYNIIPCGISNFRVSSLGDLNINISYQELDKILYNNYYRVFIKHDKKQTYKA